MYFMAQPCYAKKIEVLKIYTWTNFNGDKATYDQCWRKSYNSYVT